MLYAGRRTCRHPGQLRVLPAVQPGTGKEKGLEQFTEKGSYPVTAQGGEAASCSN